MNNTEDKLKEIIKHTNENSFKHWILISYKESSWKGETFKEARFINIEKLNYLNENIFKKENQIVKLDIEEIRTINFPLGSIIDSSGNLILTPDESSNTKFVYKNKVLIDPYEDSILPFDQEESFDTDFIDGVPCYYKRKEFNGITTTFIIPVHSLLDFFFYRNSHVTNILVNNFESILHLKKMDENLLLYPSTIINQDSAKNIGRYFFTKYNAGLRALMKINDHRSIWLNQARKSKEGKAYITTNLPFGIKTYLSVNGIYLTNKDSEERKFLVFSIESAKPANETKSFFEIEKIVLSDLTDKRSTDTRDDKPEISRPATKPQIVQPNNGGNQNEELTNEATNNSLPEVENDTIKNKKFNSDLEFEKLDRLDQLNKYTTNTKIIKEINKLSTNYNSHDGGNDTARYQAIEAKPFSFFKVFFKTMEFLKKVNYSINYLTLNNKNLNSKLTIAPSGMETKKRLKSLVISICQIEIENNIYVIIESGENKYIGMFRCSNNNNFNLIGDIRISTFLNKIINLYNYNWSKIYAEQKDKFERDDAISVLRPIEHERKRLEKLRGEKKTDNAIIDILAAKLVKKIKNRILEDIKENC